jgi:hypothetical protein
MDYEMVWDDSLRYEYVGGPVETKREVISKAKINPALVDGVEI